VPDPYGRTFQMDQQALAAIAARLEARGKHPFFERVISDYMDALGLAGPEAILDLGCGTGVAARVIARRSDARGLITAVDISAHLVDWLSGSQARRGLPDVSTSTQATRMGSGCRRAALTWLSCTP
jgi:trans-aconitate methyltransferase